MTGARLQVAIDLRLVGYRAGGIARYAGELARALVQLPDLEVAPLLSRRSHAYPGAQRLWTPPHHRFERHAIGVELALRGARPDVFHATDFIAPRLPAPVVATVHDLAFMRWPDNLTPNALGYYRQLRDAQRWTDAWITPSRWTADQLASCFGLDARAIHVVPHGAPEALLAAPVTARNERGDYVLAVGTVEPRKRYELLLDAWRGNPRLPRLIVVGASGWRTEAIQARLTAAGGVEWRRHVSDQQLRELYRRALAVLVPSRVEGFGLSALEGLAAGTPVLSSGGGALPEVTGDIALMPDATPDAWTQAVERVRDDTTLWQSLSTQGRARAATFRWSRAASETAVVYHAVAGSG
jgi:glycosyltransferase involved in cell wall biosynthesis